MKCQNCGKEYPSKYYFSTPQVCKECFERMPPATSDNKTLACPECRHRLAERHKSGITVDVCENCRGVWFDEGELEAYSQRQGNQKDTGDWFGDSFQKSDWLSLLTCPRCRSETIEYGTCADVSVARCGRCVGMFVGKSEIVRLASRKAGNSIGGQAVDIASWFFEDILAILLDSLGN